MKPLPKSDIAALRTLTSKLRNNRDFAWFWHCSIAGAIQLAGIDHKTANLAAANYMQREFSIDVTRFPEWQAFSWAATSEHKNERNYMATVSVKVNIPDGWELACETMRQVRKYEWYLDNYEVKQWTYGFPIVDLRVILRQAWQWPAWLRPEIVSIAMNKNSRWWGYSDVCQCDEVGEWRTESQPWRLDPLNLSMLPHVDDWRQSRRIKPGHEIK